ncbi:MAG: UPF0280 family protein [Proteobacteria bacterium]|nr:UPF0280 family protein [Pseudomonadota bacterium]
MYQERFYREWTDCDDLERFKVTLGESDLFILCDQNLEDLAESALRNVRAEIEGYISSCQAFKTSLVPLSANNGAPRTIRTMTSAAEAWNVGPMASVAGVVAQTVGKQLAEKAETVIIENGGDVFALAPRPIKLVLYAGESSPFKDKLAFEVNAHSGIGVCTSSGLVGPSISFGKADAVVAISRDAAFADAAATAIANQIQAPTDIASVVKEQEIRGELDGLVACCGDQLGVWGDIEIAKR